MRSVAVIGSGPGGLAAALSAAGNGARVTLFERLPEFSVKLRASGGGRCNLSNTLDDETFMRRFGREGGFLRDALSAFPDSELFAFLREHGVPVSAADGFHYFPDSGRASDISSAFRRAAEALGAEFRSGETVRKITPGFLLETEKGSFRFDAVVLACGGTAWPLLGGTDLGLKLASALGHTVRKPYPAMAPLLVRDSWPGELAGISLPDAFLEFRRGKRVFSNRGELLFTHKGFSGPCALDLAGELAEESDRAGGAELNFRPDAAKDSAFWRKELESWRTTDGAKLVRTRLGGFFPRALAEKLCVLADADECRCCDLPAEKRDLLAEKLGSGISLTASGAGPMACAMAMKGGVKLSEINPKTLESRLVRGLYFAGEMMDLTGPCGGYNIRWAFAGGFLAGRSAAEKL